MTAYITTYRGRFTAALKNLVGKTPPPTMVTHWLEGGDDAAQVCELQDWVNTNTKGLMNHIQGIAILDAARIVADNPDEGANHEPAPEPDEPFPKHEAAILGAVFQAWITTSNAKLVVVVPTVEERISFIETLQSVWDAVPFFYHAKRLDVKVYYRDIWDTLKEYPYIINLTCPDDSDD